MLTNGTRLRWRIDRVIKLKTGQNQTKPWNTKRFHQQGKRLVFTSIGTTVDGVRFGGDVRLDLKDDFKTRINLWMPFSVTQYGQTKRLEPAETTALAPLLSLVSSHLVGAVAEQTGLLLLEFDNGMTLMSPSDPEQFEYEAWQITDRHGFQVVCAIGGHIAVWMPDADTSRRRGG